MFIYSLPSTEERRAELDERAILLRSATENRTDQRMLTRYDTRTAGSGKFFFTSSLGMKGPGVLKIPTPGSFVVCRKRLDKEYGNPQKMARTAG